MTTETRYHLLNRCACCGADMGYTEVTKEDFEALSKLAGGQPISHGYCEECAAKMFAELEQAKESEAA